MNVCVLRRQWGEKVEETFIRLQRDLNSWPRNLWTSTLLASATNFDRARKYHYSIQLTHGLQRSPMFKNHLGSQSICPHHYFPLILGEKARSTGIQLVREMVECVFNTTHVANGDRLSQVLLYVCFVRPLISVNFITVTSSEYHQLEYD